MLTVATFCLRSRADINLPDVLYRKCCLKIAEGDFAHRFYGKILLQVNYIVKTA